MNGDNGVDLVRHLVVSLDRALFELVRGDVAGGDELGQSDCVVRRVLSQFHVREPRLSGYFPMGIVLLINEDREA